MLKTAYTLSILIAVPAGTQLSAVGSATWLDQGKPWAVFTPEAVKYNVDVSQYILARGEWATSAAREAGDCQLGSLSPRAIRSCIHG